MRKSHARLVGCSSTALTLAVVLIGAVFLTLGTLSGQDMLRRQTMATVERALGVDLAVGLGRQTLSWGPDGGLAIKWSDVSLTRRGAERTAARVDSIKVGISLLPLLSGQLQFRTVEIDGGTIDLTDSGPFAAADQAPPPESGPAPPVAERFTALMGKIETQLDQLQRVGVDRIRLVDVSLTVPTGAGRPPASGRIRQADLLLADRSNMTIAAVLGIEGKTVPVSGSVNFDAAAHRLAALSATAGPIDLGAFLPPGSPDDRHDDRPFATDSEATMSLQIASDEGARRRATLSLDVGPGLVQVGKGFTHVERLRGGLRYVEGEASLALVDTDIAFDGLAMTLVGHASAEGDKAGLDGFGFDLRSGELSSTVGSDSPVPIDGKLVLEGAVDLRAKEVVLSKASIETGGGSLSGEAALRMGAPDAMTRLQLTARNLGAANVKAFWPFSIAVNTRRWVLEHVGDAGVVSDGTIAINVRHDRLEPAFRPGSHPEPEELDLSIRLAGATARTVGDLPALRDGSARIHTSGGDTLVTLDAARVDGFDDIAVTPSTIAFNRAPEGALQDIDGRLELGLSGAVPQLLAVAARQPIDALKGTAFQPADATGQARVSAQLAFLIGDRVPQNKEFGAWSIAVDLDQAGLKVPFDGHTVAGMSGTAMVVPGSLSGKLDGTVDGIPASIDFTQPFGKEATGTGRVAADLTLDDAQAAKIAPALATIVTGPIKAHLERQGDAAVAARIDLGATSVSLPWIGWRKGKGVAADLSFDVEPGANATVLKNLLLKGDGFSAAGTVVADPEGLRSADLTRLALNAGDDVAVSLDRVENGYSVRVNGPSLDARPFLQDLKANLGAKARSSGSKGQLDIGIAVDTLKGFGGKQIRGFALNYAGSGGDVAALSISGKSAGGSFSADMSPRGSQRAIRLRTPDAGSLAEFTGLYDRMEGGDVTLKLTGSHDAGYRGSLTAKDFTLVNEPRLSNLVGSSPSPDSASLSQAVGTEFRTERAYFDHASAGIVYGKDGLAVTDGIIRGPVFGSSFSGTVYDAANQMDIVGSFMPAYGVNRIFGAIPLVGQILGNGNEGGLVGITYRLAGDFATPTLTVNPISVIAPGIFRSIFAYQ